MAAAHSTAERQSPVALVTGAGSGIGRAICELLSQEGYRITLLGRRNEKLEETIRSFEDQSDRVLKIVANIAQPDQARNAVDRTVEGFGRLDVLINNAGAVESVPIEKTTQDLLDHIFAVNVFGPAHLIARAWPIFLMQGGGCVVNISTMSTIDPFPGLSAYAAAKSALESLTRSILAEGRQRGIRAFTVAPGSVETAMLRSLISETDLPPDRTLDPAEVASVVVDCILGRRDRDIGRTIRLPNP